MFVVVYKLYHLNSNFPQLVFWTREVCYANLQIIMRV